MGAYLITREQLRELLRYAYGAGGAHASEIIRKTFLELTGGNDVSGIDEGELFKAQMAGAVEDILEQIGVKDGD